MKWEYKTFKHEGGNSFSMRAKVGDFEVTLNQFGAEGWELAAILNPVTEGTTTILIFKRPKG